MVFIIAGKDFLFREFDAHMRGGLDMEEENGARRSKLQ